MWNEIKAFVRFLWNRDSNSALIVCMLVSEEMRRKDKKAFVKYLAAIVDYDEGVLSNRPWGIFDADRR